VGGFHFFVGVFLLLVATPGLLCSAPFSAAILEYFLVLKGWLTELTISWDSLMSHTSPETAAAPACHKSITLVTIHGTPQLGMLGTPDDHNGHATLILQWDDSHTRCSGASL
jgi:hypothetical protein